MTPTESHAPTLADISKKSRDQIAHDLHARAVDRFRAAEAELDLACEDLYKAREAMKATGALIDIEKRPSSGAAWDKFLAAKTDPSQIESRRASRP